MIRTYRVTSLPTYPPGQHLHQSVLGIGNSTNAALLAVRILGTSYPEYAEAMKRYQVQMREEVLEKDKKLLSEGWEKYLEAKKQ